jgi:hypothetical protein
MLKRREEASDSAAFDAGQEEGYRVGYYQRRSPQTMLPEQVPSQFDNPQSQQSYVDGWQEGYFKGSRARELNR